MYTTNHECDSNDAKGEVNHDNQLVLTIAEKQEKQIISEKFEH